MSVFGHQQEKRVIWREQEKEACPPACPRARPQARPKWNQVASVWNIVFPLP